MCPRERAHRFTDRSPHYEREAEMNNDKIPRTADATTEEPFPGLDLLPQHPPLARPDAHVARPVHARHDGHAVPSGGQEPGEVVTARARGAACRRKMLVNVYDVHGAVPGGP